MPTLRATASRSTDSSAAEFLHVAAAVVMADQAVDPRGVVEIEVFVLPAVADVAHGAGRPVGLHADAEIVDDVTLADAHCPVMPGHHDFFTLPVPVCGLHDLAGGVRVAFQAGAGDGGAVRKWLEEEKSMVGMDRVVWQAIPGTAGFFRRILGGRTQHGARQGKQQGCLQQFMHYTHISESLQVLLPEVAILATPTLKCNQMSGLAN